MSTHKIPDIYSRPIYLFGEIHGLQRNIPHTFIDIGTRNFIKVIEKHLDTPIAFMEYGHRKIDFYRDHAECVYEDQELSLAGFFHSYIHMMCHVLYLLTSSETIPYESISKTCAIMKTITMEIHLLYIDLVPKNFYDMISRIPDILENKDVPIDKKITLLKKQIPSFISLNEQTVVDISVGDKTELDKYVKAYFSEIRRHYQEALKGIEYGYLDSSLIQDSNLVYIRDYLQYQKFKQLELSVDIKTPFIVLVGKAHIPYWKEFLKEYKDVSVDEMSRTTPRTS